MMGTRTATVTDTRLELSTIPLMKGQITLPARFKKALGVQDGDIFTIVRLGSVLLLSPKRLVVPRTTEAISRIREEEGVTLDELLTGLEEQRRMIYEERYAGKE